MKIRKFSMIIYKINRMTGEMKIGKRRGRTLGMEREEDTITKGERKRSRCNLDLGIMELVSVAG